MSEIPTGYGPSARRLYFDGDEDKYELWEVKMVAYMRLHKLHGVLDETISDADLDVDKNAEAFATLVQYLDDKSLSLVMRDAKDNGRKAMKILRDYYLGCSKPRIISLYSELTSLKMNSSENVIGYLIRAETSATRLKNVGETVSDLLLIHMCLKGLPDAFKPFSTVVTQKDDMNFQSFKIALRNYEENEKARISHCESNDNVFNVGSDIVCYGCRKTGHKKSDCPNAPKGRSQKRWCTNCRKNNHDTAYCRKQSSSKGVASEQSSFKGVVNDSSFSFNDDDAYIFKVSVHENELQSIESPKLLVDCGATTHILHDRSNFFYFDENFDANSHVIELADGSRKQGIVSGRGHAKVNINDVNGKPTTVILKNALLIPEYKQNILSVHSITENGSQVFFKPTSAELKSPDGNSFKITKNGKLYFLNTVSSQNVPQKVPQKSLSLKQWHCVLGHCNVNDILKMEKCVEGMKITGKDGFKCGTCAKGKMSQYRNRRADARATKPLELVHSDLSGPITPLSRENSRYVISFVDDFSGYISLYFLKNKSDAANATEKFLADVSPIGMVKTIRTDNGGEYVGSNFKNLMVANKIKHEFSSPDSPHQNGTVERNWRSLFDMTRCMLINSKLPKFLWNYALRASAYTRNRCYIERTKTTAYELFMSRKPNVSSMHEFGTVCFAYMQRQTKLNPRSEEGIFIGYCPSSPAYLIYFPDNNEVKRVRCVKFHDEMGDSFDDTESDIFIPAPFVPSNVKNISFENLENVSKNNSDKNESIIIPENVQIPEPINECNLNSENNETSSRYPSRVRKPPKYLGVYETDFCNNDPIDESNYAIDYFSLVNDVPTSYKEAIISPQKCEWQKAMEAEMSALHENQTFQLATRPNKKVVGGRWVFNIKTNDGSEQTYKARYVAKGFSQIRDIDYTETFSPTARITSVRMLMDIAAKESLVIHQMDVKTAFLNASIDCEIYIEQPEGFEKYDKDGRKYVLKLNKSLYGLKQSGRNWNSLLHSFLVSEGFQQSLADNCIYTKHADGHKIIMIIWVDDILIAASNLDLVRNVKQILSNKFKMKDLGQINHFLGIDFTITDSFIKMDQSSYVSKILSKFAMQDCKLKLIPCDPSAPKLDFEENSQDYENPRKYREIVGSLIYLMSCTRPDICYVVSLLSQHLAAPTDAHFNLAKHVLRYLRGTTKYGLVFHRSDVPLRLNGYCDSDWGASADRRSITGYCFQTSSDSSIICWKSRKQQTIALSTCEAEYMAITSAIQEANFLRQILSDMNNCPTASVDLNVDNMGAIELARNPVHHQRSKHIDIRYHYIRLQIATGTIILHYVESKDNVSDVFTKPVNRYGLQKLLFCKY